jgi:ABC-2 type transport system ATP-binding protein
VRRPTRSTWISRRTLPRSSDGRGYAEAVAGVSNAIAAERLTVRYGAVVALDDVSVALDAPSIGLLGANGAGKSTLMKALLGLVSPTSGSVQVLGFDAAHRGELRRRLGYMPEHDCLPPQMTARDLVVHLGELRGLPRRAAALRASEVLFQVGLDEERSRLIGTFSTGMKQRVKLAQALVHAPDLVVLDEPTNGLDPAGRDEMLLIVRRLWENLGVRVLLSSHVLSDVERTCEAVLLLREGHVVSAGLLSELGAGSSGRLLVRAVGNIEGFRAALAARGLEVSEDEDVLMIEGAGRRELDAVRDAAATADSSLRELRPAERTLEDAVVSAMQ